jgi:hypothetical protein
LDRWQQQCHEHADDGDNDEQLDERECNSAVHFSFAPFCLSPVYQLVFAASGGLLTVGSYFGRLSRTYQER